MSYVTQIKLEALSLSKKAIREALVYSPNATKFQKMRVPAMGMVIYILDIEGNSLGHIFKDIKEGIVYLKKN